jgi:hypothetical protein
MKKILTLLAVAGLFSLQSCTVVDETVHVDNDTISEVFEVTRSFSSSNNYSTTVGLNPAIYSSDVVLVYHLYSSANDVDVWKLMPQTYYLGNNDELDYDFAFTKYKVDIFLGANFNLDLLSSSWTQNQTFRIAIVPGNFSKSIDKNNIEEVMSALKVNENQIQKIDF